MTVDTTGNTYYWAFARDGTEISFNELDDGYASISLPFTFYMYDMGYNTVYVSTNGYISFVDSSPYRWSDLDFPQTAVQYNKMIAVLWDDWDLSKTITNPPANGYNKVFYKTEGSSPNRVFTIQWLSVSHYENGDDNSKLSNFEVSLYESSNKICIQIGGLGAGCFPDGSNTVGVNDGDGAHYNQHADLTDTDDAMDIEFVPGGNDPPTATIDSISPNPATQGQIVSFYGTGTDTDGTVEAYNWRSSLDGQLSAQEDFSTSSLSIGTHTIFFKVQDDDGAWSTEDTDTLTVTSSGGGDPNPDGDDLTSDEEESIPKVYDGNGNPFPDPDKTDAFKPVHAAELYYQSLFYGETLGKIFSGEVTEWPTHLLAVRVFYLSFLYKHTINQTLKDDAKPKLEALLDEIVYRQQKTDFIFNDPTNKVLEIGKSMNLK